MEFFLLHSSDGTPASCSEDPVDGMQGPPGWRTQENLPLSKPLTSSHLQRPFAVSSKSHQFGACNVDICGDHYLMHHIHFVLASGLSPGVSRWSSQDLRAAPLSEMGILPGKLLPGGSGSEGWHGGVGCASLGVFAAVGGRWNPCV